MKNLGMKVRATLVMNGQEVKETFRNVTEVHFHYPSVDGDRVAFESDIHGTGATYDTKERYPLWIKEFDVFVETEMADEFQGGNMTRNEMLAEIRKLRWMPYCVLDCEDMLGRPYQKELTKDAYDTEMCRGNRPWMGDGGDTAFFNDEESEKLMDAYYKERERVRALLKEYNSTHKQQLKL